ncbi:hypothetical protein [Tenacibaculum ovolyticum]|uniref:hypothetical protein n=1 Tax=Tenacibaculum ovolyticum TaxID=104270 RepID=UPI0007ED679A|nr:hypothetical protein [Tenacibaculum ovolyticum]
MRKKTLLIIIILTFSKIYCQENIKSIKQILSYKTINYSFENGKLTSKDYGYSTTFFEYNERGLLSSEYYINVNNKIKNSNNFHYNEKGYLIKIITKEGKKIIREADFKYQMNNDNDFIITKITTNNGFKGSYVSEKVFEMKDNILKIIEKKSEIRRKESINEYTFKNGNIISFFSNIKNKKERYLVKYTYDNTINVNRQIMKGFYGDKYFINSILDKPITIVNFHVAISKNNALSKGLVKKGKRIGVSEYEYKIEYNSNNKASKITKIELERRKKKTFVFKY